MKSLHLLHSMTVASILLLFTPGHIYASDDKDIEVEEIDLGALLDLDLNDSVAGSFGFALSEYGVVPFLHAYLTSEWTAEQGSINTFDAHYFNIFVGTDINGKIIPEVQLELEHGAEIGVRYAQVDAQFYDGHYVRFGQFLMPFGMYNEYYYPEYLEALPRGPLGKSMRQVPPVAWNDQGLQIRGTFTLSEALDLEYTAYVVNGLEQVDDPDTDYVEDGGDIRDMRSQLRDKNNGNKAVGGRLNFKIKSNFQGGASAYHGAYTEDGLQSLSMIGVHGGWENEQTTLRAEAAYVIQETSGDTINKMGIYARAAHRITPWFEPAVAIDYLSLGEDPASQKIGYLTSMNFYPFEEILPTFIVRAAAGHYVNGGTDVKDDIVMVQSTLGF